jgi:hypothetical protein
MLASTIAASIIVVGTLLGPEEISANGVDHGQGILCVERVLSPRSLATDRLLLRWSNKTRWSEGREDPRVVQGRTALWLLKMDPDGAVRLLDRDSVAALSDAPQVDRVLRRLREVDEGEAFETDRLLREPPPILGGEDAQPPWPPPIVESKVAYALRNYENYASNKAFAFVLDAKGNWSYGFAFGMATPELAADRALNECTVHAAGNRVESPCRLYALGDKLLWREEE